MHTIQVTEESMTLAMKLDEWEAGMRAEATTAAATETQEMRSKRAWDMSDPLTTRSRIVWTTGDFGKIARCYQAGAAEFVARQKIETSEEVLDVACGSGSLTIPAARRAAQVTGLDIAANLLDQARARAIYEGLHNIVLDEGTAEALPYEDGAFDVTLSMFGVMFAPRPNQVAQELARVTRKGGRIALANWTSDGFIGQMFKIVGKHVPPPADTPSPLLWGNEERVSERLGSSVTAVRATRRMIALSFPYDVAATVDAFIRWYGPTVRAYNSLDGLGRDAFRADLVALWSAHNQGQNGTTLVESEYLEYQALRSW